MENYDTMMYGKPSDYVEYDPSKFKKNPHADFKKPMSFVKNENIQNKSADKSDQINETVVYTEAETETKTEPVSEPAEEMKESSPNSDSVKNTNCSSLCAESVRTEEKSKEDDESHRSAADNVISNKNGLYAWNYVFSYFAEAHGVPTKTDESGAVILDRDENVFTRKPDVSTDKLDTCVSSDSEIIPADSDNYFSMPETSTDTSETHDQEKNEKIDMFDCVSKEIDEQGSSDAPDIQAADSGTSDNDCSTSENSECDKHSEPSSATPEESQTVSNIDCSSCGKPESADARNSEVDEAEEEIFIETNSEETHEILEPEENGSTEINSTVDSIDETEEEISVETNSAKTPENIVSEEKESVEVNSTDDSTLDPKGSDSEESISNKAKSTESAPSKKK
ncbi:papilin-like [Helianthus annuus]|uniref:papilin-like n=1 Tax=Helianthus annuus TaxID=4232 RepID=UPI000B8F3159|nr:papilin-like [Helianthus annuus]